AYSAAKYATEDDILILKSIVKKMKENIDNLDILTVYDFEFHSELARISRNELFVIALKVVKEGYEKFAYEVFKNNLIEWSIEDHVEIITALEKNDSKLAKSIMRKHLNVKFYLIVYFYRYLW
ncbi:MAG: FadR family transcriptional regulator, partial [Tissierellales bacterium]|nr:FadR family transcriptional regulator [Tissierellales bacterium]